MSRKKRIDQFVWQSYQIEKNYGLFLVALSRSRHSAAHINVLTTHKISDMSFNRNMYIFAFYIVSSVFFHSVLCFVVSRVQTYVKYLIVFFSLFTFLCKRNPKTEVERRQACERSCRCTKRAKKNSQEREKK